MTFWQMVVPQPSPPKISESTGRITMKFLPDIKLYEEVQILKKIFDKPSGP